MRSDISEHAQAAEMRIEIPQTAKAKKSRRGRKKKKGGGRRPPAPAGTTKKKSAPFPSPADVRPDEITSSARRSARTRQLTEATHPVQCALHPLASTIMVHRSGSSSVAENKIKSKTFFFTVQLREISIHLARARIAIAHARAARGAWRRPSTPIDERHPRRFMTRGLDRKLQS